jgi:hypothetical protein
VFKPFIGSYPNDILAHIEHHSWLSKQHALFAQLLETAVEKGLAAVQTQHPGLYYAAAADELVSRQRYIDRIPDDPSDTATYSPLDESLLQYYGQRPWTSVDEASAIAALQLASRQLPSASLHLLSAAIAQFKRYNCPRMKRHTIVRMADEYFRVGEHAKSLQMLVHVVWEYRHERWPHLLITILYKILACAFLLANVKEYVAAAFELLNPHFDRISADERTRIHTNVQLILAGCAPNSEPTCDQQRATDALQTWARLLTERCFFMVQMRRIHACVEMRARFLSGESIVCDQILRVQVCVNR